MNIGIVIICTNGYLPLGIRLIKKFIHHYKGSNNLKFIVFNNEPNIYNYLSEIEIPYVESISNEHKSWQDSTNSKFTNILSIHDMDLDFIYYIDSDTNIKKDFDDSWFIIGDLVAGEHFANRTSMLHKKNFDRNIKSCAFILYDSNEINKMYYYGAFFGGRKSDIIKMCEILYNWQIADKLIGYEPCVNDESYLNKYFDINKPSIIFNNDFKFIISDKGGFNELRNIHYVDKDIIKNMISHKDIIYDIINGKITID